jgi:hypothetical protein
MNTPAYVVEPSIEAAEPDEPESLYLDEMQEQAELELVRRQSQPRRMRLSHQA